MPNRKRRKAKKKWKLRTPEVLPETNQRPEGGLTQSSSREDHRHEADKAVLEYSTQEPHSLPSVTTDSLTSLEVSAVSNVFISSSMTDLRATKFRESSISETVGAKSGEQYADTGLGDDNDQLRNLKLDVTYAPMAPACDAEYNSIAMYKTTTADKQMNSSEPPSSASVGSNDEELHQAMQMQNVKKVLQILKKADTCGISQGVLDKALMEACRQGHKFLVQTLVRSGASVHSRDTDGITPLLICAEKGFTDIVRFLVKKGAKINTANAAGDTALILSIRPAGSMDMTKFLLSQKDIDVDHENQQGYTALKKALEAMDVDTVKLLIDEQKCTKRFSYLGEPSLRPKDMERLEETADSVGLGRVVKLLQENSDENDKPLLKAALAHDKESFDILIDSHFSEAEVRNNYFVTILEKILGEYLKNSEAITAPGLAIIKTLLANGAEVNQSKSRNFYVDAPIITATKIGSYELVQLLCEYRADLDVRAFRDDKDPMTIAAEIGRPDLINLLINFGGKVNKSSPYNSRDDGQYTYNDSALDMSLRNGHTDCAMLLLKQGADMNVSAALSSAVKHKALIYLQFLFDNFGEGVQQLLSDTEKSTGNELFCTAVGGGDVDIVKMLLDGGCSVHGSSDKGKIPLTEAKNVEMVQLLIRRGADVNQKPTNIYEYGHTVNALFDVISKYRYPHNECSEKENIISVLLENGGRIDDADDCGQTPVMKAAAEERALSVLRILLSHGADVNKKDNLGKIPLMYAIDKRCTDNAKVLVEFMTEHGINLDIQNNNGSTALMAAVNASNIEVVQLLIEKGADVNLEDDKGDTALIIAAGSHIKTDMLNILIKSGAEVNHRNKVGYTALMKASQNTNKDALRLLIDSRANVNCVSEDGKTTALSILVETSEVYKDIYSCVEYLLERGASASFLAPDALFKVIQEGKIKLVPKLISHGLGPAERQSNSALARRVGFVVSPLCLALLEGNVDLARYFHGNWFLTNSDVTSLPRNEVLRQILDSRDNKKCSEFLDDIRSQPVPLLKLAFIAVSSAIGCVPRREEKVNSLPLPSVLKEKLLFKQEEVTLQVPDAVARYGRSVFRLTQQELLMAMLASGDGVEVDDYVPYCSSDNDSYDHDDYGVYYDSDDY